MFQLYYTAFLAGFSISFTTFWAVTYFSPPKGPGSFDAYEEWTTSTLKEGAKLSVIPNNNAERLVNTRFSASGYERQGPRVLKDQELDMQTAAPVEISEKAE